MATFDHKKESFIEAIGFEEKDMDELNTNLANMSKHVIKTSCKQSELCEEIAKVFSYNELLLIATLYVTEKTADIVNKNPSIISTILLSRLIKDLEADEEKED